MGRDRRSWIEDRGWESGKTARRRFIHDPPSTIPLLDRWILERLHAVTAECLKAYETYEFRKVFNALNNFCTHDLSAVYIDATKDRMYCDAADSPRRRASQAAMLAGTGGLTAEQKALVNGVLQTYGVDAKVDNVLGKVKSLF